MKVYAGTRAVLLVQELYYQYKSYRPVRAPKYWRWLEESCPSIWICSMPCDSRESSSYLMPTVSLHSQLTGSNVKQVLYMICTPMYKSHSTNLFMYTTPGFATSL